MSISYSRSLWLWWCAMHDRLTSRYYFGRFHWYNRRYRSMDALGPTPHIAFLHSITSPSRLLAHGSFKREIGTFIYPFIPLGQCKVTQMCVCSFPPSQVPEVYFFRFAGSAGTFTRFHLSGSIREVSECTKNRIPPRIVVNVITDCRHVPS